MDAQFVCLNASVTKGVATLAVGALAGGGRYRARITLDSSTIPQDSQFPVSRKSCGDRRTAVVCDVGAMAQGHRTSFTLYTGKSAAQRACRLLGQWRVVVTLHVADLRTHPTR